MLATQANDDDDEDDAPDPDVDEDISALSASSVKPRPDLGRLCPKDAMLSRALQQVWEQRAMDSASTVSTAAPSSVAVGSSSPSACSSTPSPRVQEVIAHLRKLQVGSRKTDGDNNTEQKPVVVCQGKPQTNRLCCRILFRRTYFSKPFHIRSVSDCGG